MRVVAFVGASGTGKSHRAAFVAKEKKVQYLIDDGLLIKNGKMIAGKSAKREPTKIGSVKCALFKDRDHRERVVSVIRDLQPDAILILGTSDGMVEHIANVLELPLISERVYITEIASEYEIKQAMRIRKEQGKHVVPVPTFEIKKDFSGLFLDPLQIFRRKGNGHYQLIGGKSVVRPTFSFLGKYTISDYTIYQICEYAALKIEGVHKISRFRVDNQSDGVLIEMDLILVFGYVIKPLLRKVQDVVTKETERITALNIKALDIYAKSLVLPQKVKKI